MAMISASMGVGANLKRLREGLDQPKSGADIARAAGLSPQKVSDYERGVADKNPTLKMLFKLAQAVPCTVEDLVSGIDPDYDLLRQSSSYSNKLTRVASPGTGPGVSSAQAEPTSSAAAIGGNSRGTLAEDRSPQSVVDAQHLAGIANDERLLTIARQLSAVSGDLNALVRTPDSSGADRAPGRDTSGPDVSRPPARRKTQR